MKALITGASSGIGKEMAIYLAEQGIGLVLVGRDKKRLQEVKDIIKSNVSVDVVPMDLSVGENCIELFEKVKDIDILINNAGFGTCGEFTNTDLIAELNMINTNICAVHMLTKLYLQHMSEKNSGYILNVASIAAFMPGPLMATYYATKAYVYKLTESIWEELNKKKSNVSISVLCPGPINTKFLDTANVKFKVKLMSSKYVAEYAIDNMFKKKRVIVPGFQNKCIMVLSKIVPDKLIAKFIYNQQEQKVKTK